LRNGNKKEREKMEKEFETIRKIFTMADNDIAQIKSNTAKIRKIREEFEAEMKALELAEME
jgi:hypothetical protein